MEPKFESEVFNINSEETFQERALEIFYFQAKKNAVYKEYMCRLKVNPSKIQSISEIPFLPGEFFKNHKVYSSLLKPEAVFESSGTTGAATAKHYIARTGLYEMSFTKCFSLFYGDYADICILALLPSYLERQNSSLVYMMNYFISNNRHPDSGFYLDDLDSLSKVLYARTEDRYPTLLFGVSFALLDMSEKFPVSLTDNIIVMETGGMKGRRDEITRSELHDYLKNTLHTDRIHSEYGMTELLSQAYSKGEGKFQPPPWMKVFCRDVYDPLSFVESGHTGGINIIDLANIYSCSFIETSDLGKVWQDGRFEVAGRFDRSDIRGCNLLVS